MSFSTSVARVGDTTGYTSNKGVWAKAMFTQQQQRGPFTKKRKKWNLVSDPACYKISEHEDEEEGVKLPQIVAPEPNPAAPVIETSPRYKHVAFNIDDVAFNANEDNDKPVSGMFCSDSGSAHTGVFGPASGSSVPELPDAGQNIPEIVVEECQQDRPRSKGKEEEPGLSPTLLMPPTRKKNKAVFVKNIPEAAVYAVYRSKKEEAAPETNGNTPKYLTKYLTSPRYTHIRVPRRHMLITHVSQESIDSPLSFPKIDTETVGRKPVTVTFTKSLNLGKGRVRRRWNFHSLNDPIQIYTRPKSSSSAKSDVSPDPESLVSNRKSDSHDGRNSDNKRMMLQHYEANMANSGATGMMNGDTGKLVVNISKNGALSRTNRRKKWVLPEHWPSSQDPGVGQ